MSAPTIIGTRISLPFAKYEPHQIHEHHWTTIEAFVGGKLMKIHECTGHKQPIRHPFELLILTDAEVALMEAI